MRITPTEVLAMLLDLQTLRMVVEFSALLMAAYRLLRPHLRNLGIGHNRIWTKVDKVGSKFSMIKDHITLRRTFGKYWIVIPTREEFLSWVTQLRKEHVWFTDGACNQQGTSAGISKYQSKVQWHISLGQDATAF